MSIPADVVEVGALISRFVCLADGFLVALHEDGSSLGDVVSIARIDANGRVKWRMMLEASPQLTSSMDSTNHLGHEARPRSDRGGCAPDRRRSVRLLHWHYGSSSSAAGSPCGRSEQVADEPNDDGPDCED